MHLHFLSSNSESINQSNITFPNTNPETVTYKDPPTKKKNKKKKMIIIQSKTWGSLKMCKMKQETEKTEGTLESMGNWVLKKGD